MEYPSIVAPSLLPLITHQPIFRSHCLFNGAINIPVRVKWPAFKIEHNDPHQSLNLDTQI